MKIREVAINGEVLKVRDISSLIWEENNMNKIDVHNEIRRIFGFLDPMHFVEEVASEMDPVYGDYKIQLTLHVPGSCGRFLKSSPVYASQVRVDCLGDGVVVESGAEKDKKESDADFVKPDRVVYSGPKTILMWPDGTKTIVSLMEGDEHDEYAAFCSAIVKKMFGSTHKAKKFLDSIKTYKDSNPRKCKKKLQREMVSNDR